MSATASPGFQLDRRSRSTSLAAGGTPSSWRYRSAQAIRTASGGPSLDAANDSYISSFWRSRSALRRSHSPAAVGRCDSASTRRYCHHHRRLASEISAMKTLDSWEAIAIKNSSDQKTVCLWRRFFRHSFVPCRRFARLYPLLREQHILTSRVLHPFGDPRLAFLCERTITLSVVEGFRCSPGTRCENDNRP